MSSKGWLHNLDPEINMYFVRKDEITLQSGFLRCEIHVRVIVPSQLRPHVFEELHIGTYGTREDEGPRPKLYLVI